MAKSVLGEEAPPASEQFLDKDYGIPFADSRQRLRVGCCIPAKKGFRARGLSARGNREEKQRTLVFEVVDCDVPAPYDVYWKIRNTGEEAERAGQLRGEIHRDGGGRERREPTAYRGSHYVECFVVKDGECVATTRHPVFVV